MSFFFPNIDGCEALLPARQPERKTSSNSKDSTKKMNLVLCWSWSCETMVWWICTKRMNWFCKKILSKWTMQYTNETFHTHTHLSFSVLLIEFLPTLDSWDMGGLWETLNDFERLRYGVSLAQNLERGGSIRERTLTKKTLRERVLRERDGIAGEGPTRAIKTHPELWAQLEKIWQWAAKTEPNILTHGNFTYLGSFYYIVTPVAVTQNKNIVKHQIQSLSWYITCKMPAYILTQITASFWIRAIDAAGFWSRKIVGSEPAQARIQCCNHQEFQNVLFFVDHWPILIKKET